MYIYAYRGNHNRAWNSENMNNISHTLLQLLRTFVTIGRRNFNPVPVADPGGGGGGGGGIPPPPPPPPPAKPVIKNS